jgi:hypothetical protein
MCTCNFGVAPCTVLPPPLRASNHIQVHLHIFVVGVLQVNAASRNSECRPAYNVSFWIRCVVPHQSHNNINQSPEHVFTNMGCLFVMANTSLNKLTMFLPAVLAHSVYNIPAQLEYYTNATSIFPCDCLMIFALLYYYLL